MVSYGNYSGLCSDCGNRGYGTCSSETEYPRFQETVFSGKQLIDKYGVAMMQCSTRERMRSIYDPNVHASSGNDLFSCPSSPSSPASLSSNNPSVQINAAGGLTNNIINGSIGQVGVNHQFSAANLANLQTPPCLDKRYLFSALVDDPFRMVPYQQLHYDTNGCPLGVCETSDCKEQMYDAYGHKLLK